MFLKGLDLRYMPQIAIDREIYDFHPPALTGEALNQIFNFCECLGYQLTWDTLMNHNIMHRHGCKYFLLY